MALVITEDWVRDRVSIKHDSLDNVRSLSLPGTYHEKISGFGDSLKHFSRLKSLDVSRNAVESLSGLENLKLLEKLNLYYNNIPSLSELSKLRANTKLQELDLRLNPVARVEPDYRLFLIHMLPNLRRLDDRAVRDMERKAALMHFSTDQATLLTDRPFRPPTPEQRSNPRVEHVRSLAKTPMFYEDDEALISQVVRTEGNLSRNVITGSSSKTAASEEYPPEVIRQMNKAYLTSSTGDLPTAMKSVNVQSLTTPLTEKGKGTDGGLRPSANQANAGQMLNGMNAETMQSKYPNLYPIILSASNSDDKDQNKARQQFSTSSSSSYTASDNYASNKVVGHFTPNPEMYEAKVQLTAAHSPPSAAPTGVNINEETGWAVEMYGDDEADDDGDSPPSDLPVRPSSPLPPLSPTSSNVCGQHPVPASNPQTTATASSGGSTKPQDVFIGRISDLADKYWNGAKSLLKNQRFNTNVTELIRSIQQDQLVQPVSNGAGDTASTNPSAGSSSLSLQRQLDHLRSELNRACDDNMRLHEKVVAMTMDSGLSDDGGGGSGLPGDETKLKSSLIRAQRDLGILRGRLLQVTEENKALSDRIAELQSVTRPPAVPSGSTDDRSETERLLLDNNRLKEEIETLNVRLRQSAQMQQLATMLQDSHKSLVQTNEHLLKELNEARHPNNVQRNNEQQRR